ncbi:hypothetical protein [Rathayibacter sp. PhB152]|uniref:hypothetical protein n=1 Tax=Rathayibacter sp. PhB152 TaxID=2485190 RepID=UPI00161D5EDF|nr:hypothetical protein [Rathayibacter sp. PhB152]
MLASSRIGCRTSGTGETVWHPQRTVARAMDLRLMSSAVTGCAIFPPAVGAIVR